MAKVIFFYQQPKDLDGFEAYYSQVHHPLLKMFPNSNSVSIQRVIRTQNTDLNLYLLVELQFESLEILQQSIVSPEAEMAIKDLENLF